jgi:Na+-transporting NADH:ubiquinone oxidoreductase subunit NqrA
MKAKQTGEARLSQIAADQQKDDNEHLVAKSQLEGEVKKREHSVAILSRRIAECEALINGTDLPADLRSGPQPS